MVQYQNIFETFNSTENGLDTNEVIYRLKKYGLNQLAVKKSTPLFLKVLQEFTDPMILLLIFATFIAFFNNNTTDGLLILSVILLNGFISFFQKYRAERAIEALKKMVSPQARVMRNNQQAMINTAEIVPGDVIILSEGDTIPADAIVFQANELETSEAILTGESSGIGKKPFNLLEKGALSTEQNTIYMGTTISRGNARALVIQTGMETEFGKIADLTQETKKDQTPLQKEIYKLGIFAAQITLVIVTLIFAFEYIVHHRSILDNLIFSSSIAVAAVPEGLPAVITIALALGVLRLSKKNAIIRQLSSVETLGATTVICTDKTGTLTKNEMTVTDALTDDFYLNFEGVGYTPKGKFTIFGPDQSSLDLSREQITAEFVKKNAALSHSLRLFGLCAYLCNNASLVNKNDSYSILGDPTEGALLVMAEKLNFFAETDNLENLQQIHELPFDSGRKLMTKVYLDKKQGKYYVFTKGAPDQLINFCDQRLHFGKTVILTKGIKENLIKINEQYSSQALRTIALAYKEIPAQQLKEILSLDRFQDKIRELEKKLVFLGIAGISDPPREEVRDAVKSTELAGIKTYIITGDHGYTTAAIAHKVGLISEQRPFEIIPGDVLDRMSDHEIKERFKDKNLDLIFSRNKPEHKLRLVSLLKENREIVAVTGDGVNDAPALKRADIGVAMGITGSDVSKEASNMILIDDSFSTIVTAIHEGRTIYANLKKFISYIFSTNVGEIFTITLSLLIGLEAPLTAVLLLTINFVTDLFPALALGVEPAEPDIMIHPPRSPEAKIMDKPFIKKILAIGILIGILMIVLYLYKLFSHNWNFGQDITAELLRECNSLIFAGLVFIQIAVSFNAKSDTESILKINPFNNWKLISANLFSAILTFLIIQWSPLQSVFKTTGLGWLDWALVIVVCLLMTISLEIAKYKQRQATLSPTSHVGPHPQTA